MHHQTQPTEAKSLLARLRSLIPSEAVSERVALLVAEAQAARLRAAIGSGYRFDTGRLASLPRLRLEKRSLPTSGVTYWDGQRWRIAVNADEPSVRQRFTLLHEYKHVIDHGATARLYGTETAAQRERAEAAADYFAGCVLVPRSALIEAWVAGASSLVSLAARFGVSERAVQVRLSQVGLDGARERCARPVRSVGEQRFQVVERRVVA